MFEDWLTDICAAVDNLLFRHGHADRVAGGYCAGKSILLSLTGTLFLDNHMVSELVKIFDCEIVVTVGVIMLHNPPINVVYEIHEVANVIAPPIINL